jgi:hypothetical protein
VYLAITLARYPELVLHPRFWAEEGTVYFQAAYDRGFVAVFESHQGYFALLPNMATWLATTVPLQYAPIVTLVISAAVQALPALLVLRSRSSLFTTGVRIAVLGALLVTPSGTIELWLNTVNSQSFLQAVVFVLLLAPRLRWYHLLLLLGCLLSTPTVVVPAFAFVVRALIRRKPEEWAGAAVWLVSVGVQALQLRPGVRPFAGPRVWLVSTLRENFGQAWFGAVGSTQAMVGGVLVLCLLAAALIASRQWGLAALGLVGVAAAVANTALSLSGGGGPRYSFGPFVMVFIVLASVAAGPLRGRLLSFLIAGLLAITLFTGALIFKDRQGLAWQGPSWEEQVLAHSQVITIWPYPPWHVIVR